MRQLLILLAILGLAACENPRFDKDRRQIMAKDVIRRSLGRSRGFDITAFREDTMDSWPDTFVKRPIQYTLDFTYTDSVGGKHFERGRVVFTPDGKSVLGKQTEPLPNGRSEPTGTASNVEE